MRGSVSTIQVCVSGFRFCYFGPYSADLLLPTFSTLCRAKINLSRFYASDYSLLLVLVRGRVSSIKVCACRLHPSCLQGLMRGRILHIKVHASNPSLLSVSYAGESYLLRGSHIWFFGFITWTPDYPAFSILCRGEFHLLSFTHPILCLYYFADLVLPPLSISCRGEFSTHPIPRLYYSANLFLSALSISCGREFYPSRLAYLILPEFYPARSRT